MDIPIEQILEELKEIKRLLHGLAETESPKKDDEVYLSRCEAAEFLKCSKGTLHNWQKSGRLTPIIIGKKRLYPKSLLLKSSINQ
jgi:excisionase family DNA binding protein